MEHENIFIGSVKQSFSLIRKNKLLFFFLFILQIIFFVVFFYVSITYQTRMLESAKAISDYLSQLQLDDVSIASNMLQQKDILGDDPLAISRNFNEMVKNFRIYMVYVLILLIVFTSIAWAMTNKLIHKSTFRQLTSYFFRIFIVSIFYLGLIFSFFYSVFNISLFEASAQASKLLIKYSIFAVISIILFYFMLISFSLLHNTSLRDIVQKTLRIGVKKIHYILGIHLINILLFFSSIILLYLFIEKNVFLLFLSMILLVFSFVFGRILLVNFVERLDKAKTF